jgi:uncharacterized membrane protein YbhN (UPF0104 family)
VAESRSTSKTWLKVAMSALVLAVLFVVLPWAEVRASFSRLSLSVWVAVLGGFLFGHLVGAYKWWSMLTTMGVPFSLREGVRCYAAGLFANLCLPGIVGGDVVRASLATRGAGRVEAVVLGSLADRGIDLTALAVVMGAGALFAGSQVSSTIVQVGLWLLAAGLAGGLLAGFLLVLLPGQRWLGRFRRPLMRIRVALRKLTRRPSTAIVCFTLALGIQGGFVLLNAWIGRSLGVAVPIEAWFVAWPLAKLAGLLPVSLGGLGVRDATLGAILVVFGAGAAEGVVTSLIWQTVLICGGLLAGALWWGMSSASSRDLRRISE